MTVAAIYARFSSDSQRDESIEIQVEQCTAFIEKHGWQVGEIYTDYARTGKTDARPSFLRCMDDGLNGAYDVLVFYKRDRFARKVIDSRKYKEKLQEKGVRIFSLREGESKNTPDGFLHEVIDEAFAEYYSLNLAVLIKDGIQKNAENCKASGVRKFDYDVDENDHYVLIDGGAGRKLAFRTYLDTQSSNVTADALNAAGHRTVRGNEWTPNAVLKLLRDRANIGEYAYAGHVVEGGIPAAIDRSDFFEVQAILDSKSKGRRYVSNDYLLSSKLYCLKCGAPMHGQSGTGKSGKKYTYYSCVTKDGCRARVPSKALEEAVLTKLREMLSDKPTVDDMVASLLEYLESLPDNSENYRLELAQAVGRKQNLITAIEEGLPAASVVDAVKALDEKIEKLEKLLAREEFQKAQRYNEPEVRNFLSRYIATHDAVLVESFIKEVYVDDEFAVVLFNIGGEAPELTLEELQALKTSGTPSDSTSEGVRTVCLWWSIGGSNP